MILLILVILINSILPYQTVWATEKNTCFARVLFEQVYLYKTAQPNDATTNVYFELPRTYFVELLSKENDFYKAKYMDIVGYVKKDSVQAVEKAPANPFLTNINFRVYAELSEQLRSSPNINQSSNLIVSIPHLNKSLTYYGKIIGQCLIDGRTNIWYYCKFTSDKEYFGYVYSDFCDEMNPLLANNEDVKYINNPTFEPIKPETNTIPEDSDFVGILIAILSIPAIIFLFLLLKNTKIISRDRMNNKEIIDY